MTITPLPTPPTTSDPANFPARADAFVAALPVFQAETNSALAAMGSLNLVPAANKIINGGMVLDLRNAGASLTITNGNIYTLDRFFVGASVASKLSCQQNAGAVTPPAGFTYYLGITSLSAYSVGAAETFALQQRIEGLNISDLSWGTANAKSVTLSFWVRSSLTGTFGGAMSNSAADRSYPFSYTISAANTWEQKSIIIAGDTTGTWLTTTGIGIRLSFSLGVGSTLSGSASAWAAANYLNSTGSTSVVGTNGATFYITGVKMEPGSVATPYVEDNYAVLLQKCQRYGRYLFKNTTGGAIYIGDGHAENGVTAYCTYLFPEMRTAPSATISGSLQFETGAGATPSLVGTNSFGSITASSAVLGGSGYTGLASPGPSPVLVASNAYVFLNAEL